METTTQTSFCNGSPDEASQGSLIDRNPPWKTPLSSEAETSSRDECPVDSSPPLMFDNQVTITAANIAPLLLSMQRDRENNAETTAHFYLGPLSPHSDGKNNQCLNHNNQDNSNDVADEDDSYALSTLPWRQTLHEVPSLSVMASEGTCPSLYVESTDSSHHLAHVTMRSKLDYVGDDEGYISHARGSNNGCTASVQHHETIPTSSNDDNQHSADVTALDQRISELHCSQQPWRHQQFYQHHSKLHHHRDHHRDYRNGMTSSTPQQRFVLGVHKDWEKEEEESWRSLEDRVWSWLDRMDLTECITPTVDWEVSLSPRRNQSPDGGAANSKLSDNTDLSCNNGVSGTTEDEAFTAPKPVLNGVKVGRYFVTASCQSLTTQSLTS